MHKLSEHIKSLSAGIQQQSHADLEEFATEVAELLDLDQPSRVQFKFNFEMDCWGWVISVDDSDIGGTGATLKEALDDLIMGRNPAALARRGS